MGSGREPPRPTIVENGLEPEFVIDSIIRVESTGHGQLLRLYVGNERRGAVVVSFTVVATPGDFARMAQQVLRHVQDTVNADALWASNIPTGEGH